VSRRGGGRGSSLRRGGGGGGAPAYNPADFGTLYHWRRGDDVTLNGSDVSSWNDKSGNGRHAIQGTAALQPAFTASALNGLPGITFVASAGEFFTDSIMSALTAAERFIVLRLTADPPVAGTGLWRQSLLAAAPVIPFTDGIIYDDFGTTVRKTCGNPTPSMATACLYNPRTAAGAWACDINGANLFTTATNTVGFSTGAATLGTNGSGNFLDGILVEDIMFSAVLTAPNRLALSNILRARYGVP